MVAAADLIADGRQHQLAIDLSGKIRTAQIDQLIFTLPAHTSLNGGDLSFVAKPTDLPCNTWSHAAPTVDATALAFTGPIRCSNAVATSLRGREAIRIDASHAHGSAVYLSMLFYSLALSNYLASQPTVWAGTSDPSMAVVRVHYSDGVDEQFLWSSRRSSTSSEMDCPDCMQFGLQTNGPDRAQIMDGVDSLTQLPVISLYGDQLEPSASALSNIDVVLLDLPDVGCRCYTYLWILSYVM